jgi:aldose 1-epimerase
VSAPSGEQFELVDGDRRVVAVEVGGGLRTYTCGGRDVLLGYGEDELCGSARGQVLVPWPNRIAEGRYVWEGEELQLPLDELSSGSAIHGLVRWRSWHAVEREEARIALEHVLRPRPGYPFALRVRVEYRLEERGLVVATEAENVGTRACPFGAGHHPYVAAPDGVDALVLEGGPVGERRLDETEHRPGGWRVRAGDVTVWADASWPWLQLFSGDLPDIRRRGLAVEPMTCPPQAFRTGEGVLRLEPGETFRGTWGIDD